MTKFLEGHHCNYTNSSATCVSTYVVSGINHQLMFINYIDCIVYIYRLKMGNRPKFEEAIQFIKDGVPLMSPQQLTESSFAVQQALEVYR